jgi:hypothetical protein
LDMMWISPPKVHVLEAWSQEGWYWGGRAFKRWDVAQGN